jgi:hypothetical protein
MLGRRGAALSAHSESVQHCQEQCTCWSGRSADEGPRERGCGGRGSGSDGNANRVFAESIDTRFKTGRFDSEWSAGFEGSVGSQQQWLVHAASSESRDPPGTARELHRSAEQFAVAPEANARAEETALSGLLQHAVGLAVSAQPLRPTEQRLAEGTTATQRPTTANRPSRSRKKPFQSIAPPVKSARFVRFGARAVLPARSPAPLRELAPRSASWFVQRC